MKKKKITRLLSRAVAIALTISVLSPLVYAAPETSNSLSNWVPVYTVNGDNGNQNLNSDSGVTTIVGKDETPSILTNISTTKMALSKLIESDNYDLEDLLQQYMLLLVYMSWTEHNVYYVVNSSNSEPTGEIKTVFDVYGDNESVEFCADVYEELVGKTADISSQLGIDLRNLNGLNPEDYSDILSLLVKEYADAKVRAAIDEEDFNNAGISRDEEIAALVEQAKTTKELAGEEYNEAELRAEISNSFTLTEVQVAMYNTKYQEVREYLNLITKLSAEKSRIDAVGLGSKVQDSIVLRGYRDVLGSSKTISSMLSEQVRLIHAYHSAVGNKMERDEVAELPSVDLSGGTLGVLANAKLTDSGAHFDGDPQMTNIGYFVLAAGVIYDPFVSIAGNETYIATLKELFTTSDQQEELISALQKAINVKKPLYVTEGTKDAWTSATEVTEIPIADYHYATLADMLQIDQKVTKAYAVVEGRMQASKVDSSTWEYVQGGSSAYDTSQSSTAPDSSSTAEVVREDTEPNKTVAGYSVTASGHQMSKPVAFTSGSSAHVFLAKGNTIPAGIGGLTSMILHNAMMDVRSSKYLEAPGKHLLFLNGLGDIVLQDGTVILPAISNPILYDYGTTDLSSGESTNIVEGVFGGIKCTVPFTAGYYPYNAAFANHYPSARVGKNLVVYLSNKNDKGKYILSYEKQQLEAIEIEYVNQSGSSKTMETSEFGMTRSVPIFTKSFSTDLKGTDIHDAFPMYVGKTGNHIFTIFGEHTRFYVTYDPIANGEGISFFPVKEGSSELFDSYLSVAKPLITSAVHYISDEQGAGNVRPSSGRFRIQSYLEDFVAQGLLGTYYSETLVKNFRVSYEDLVEDQYNRLTVLLMDVAAGMLDSVGHIDGVLALKNGYENSFFNAIVQFLQEFYVLIAVILLTVLAVKFLKGHCNMIYIAFISAVVFASFEVYAVWMPTALPGAYNFFVNDIVEDVVWDTVTYKAEQYEETYFNSLREDKVSGELRPYTATITLYKMTMAEIESVAERVGVDYDKIISGDIVYLDSTAGIFIQGDAIKMSVDRLFTSNSMRGLYQSQWKEVQDGVEELEPISENFVQNPYIIKLTEPYVSLESYYTPFCLIERAFLVNLNNFTNLFQIERNYYQYGRDLYKDAFVFNAFTNSAIFTSPDKPENLALNINLTEQDGMYVISVEEVIDKAHRYFDPWYDWLNLRSIFVEPSASLKSSLWGEMLQRKGYYDDHWNVTDPDGLTDLITYINTQTKQFVIRNQSQLNFCSDENAIKLVSLYATTCFTHRISEFGYWLYPNYINAADIELVDVLYGSMTTLEDRNTAIDGELINTITLNLGLPGILLISAIVVLSVIFIFIITYLVPILYAVFGIILVFKLLNEEQNIGLIQGYTKVTLTTVILYMCYSFGLKLVSIGHYRWYGYLGTAVITALCVYFLFYVVIAVVTNPMELGNETLARTLFSAADKLTGNRLSRISTQSINIHTRNSFGGMYPGVSQFMRRSPMDFWHGGFQPRRTPNQGYGRWDDFDDYSSRGDRLSDRIGKFVNRAATRITEADGDIDVPSRVRQYMRDRRSGS